MSLYKVEGCFNCPFNEEDDDCHRCKVTAFVQGKGALYYGVRTIIPQENVLYKGGEPSWCPIFQKEISFTILDPLDPPVVKETEDDDVLI